MRVEQPGNLENPNIKSKSNHKIDKYFPRKN